ncbi:unnamed protein product [Euphydryas editha]|uniref:Uncharacterized protein n=1 Tax=Euphydryas editha TaxID=104508 RepID=A0AAU9USF9_EUPED|nr:unnamed protein product [Euphydryas editha]
MAGFRKTSIYPLNVDEILSRLPQEETNSEANKSFVSHSVLDLLKEMRYRTTNITDRKRKIKLNVISGKSVSSDETDDNADSEQNNSKKRNK